jgi:ABC-2 type transport system ATP-binding protein
LALSSTGYCRERSAIRESPEDAHKTPRNSTVVTAEGLTKDYGKVRALDALTVNIPPGITGLVGSNGAGKSTFLKIILGMLRRTSGSLNVLGYNPSTEGELLRQYIGYMPEHDCLPPDTSATEFVAAMAQVSGLPHSAARERTAETLRHVGLNEERYRPIGGYSTGMKQRVKLAQALVHDPQLLLLDEPTNGLDPARRAEMLDLIRQTGRDFGISIIVSSHLLSEIEKVCDFLVVIEGGQLHSSAPLTDFTRESGVLAIDVEEGAEGLVTTLSAAGINAVLRDSGGLDVTVEGETTLSVITRVLADSGVSLVRMEHQRSRLEDIFAETAGA